jgi:hypothetical protein
MPCNLLLLDVKRVFLKGFPILLKADENAISPAQRFFINLDAAYFYEKGKVKNCHRATNCKVKITDSTLIATNLETKATKFIEKATSSTYKELNLCEMAQISVKKKTVLLNTMNTGFQ